MKTDKTNIKQIGDSVYLLVPVKLYKDSKFPFKLNDDLEISIINKKLLIEK